MMAEQAPLLALSHDAVRFTVHIHELQNRSAAQQMASEERATREVKQRALMSGARSTVVSAPVGVAPTTRPERTWFSASAVRKIALNTQLGKVPSQHAA